MQTEKLKEILNRAKKVDPAIVAELVAAMRIETDLSLFDGGVTISGGGAHRTTLEFLAEWLILQSLKTNPDDAIGDVEWYLSLDSVPAYQILALGGITTDHEVSLVDGIKLVPYSNLPPSYLRNRLLDVPWGLVNDLQGFGRSLMPTAALIVAIEQKEKMVRSFVDLPGPFSANTVFPVMRKIAHCLTLVGPNSVTPIAEWTELDPRVPLGHLGSGSGGSIHELMPTNTVDVTGREKEIHSIVNSYLGLSNEMQQKLNVPISRVSLSLKRHSPVERAIELRIALESLLTSDLNSSTSYNLRLRGAMLGSDSLAGRQEIFDCLKSVYNLRSTAVHNGFLGERDLEKAPEILDRGTQICTNLILRIIERKSFPDWNSFILNPVAN